MFNMPTLASGRPTESRKGTTVYQKNEHGGKKIVVRATKVSIRGSGGVQYQTIAHWCPVCRFQLSDKGKQLQIETLEGLTPADKD